jgi:succinate dehydrogenase hydrophobic anchor subunit
MSKPVIVVVAIVGAIVALLLIVGIIRFLFAKPDTRHDNDVFGGVDNALNNTWWGSLLELLFWWTWW